MYDEISNNVMIECSKETSELTKEQPMLGILITTEYIKIIQKIKDELFNEEKEG